MKRIALFIGTRPEAIKLAPVYHELVRAPDLVPVVISTGQHREMLEQVLDLFEIPVDHELQVMRPNQTLAGLTARLCEGVDQILTDVEPDFALVQGDTTTVLVSALCCFYRRIGVGHVEAGLRTHDLSAPFPEEGNRVLASRIARLHFAPTEGARENLEREGIRNDCIVVTGNTVVDALFLELARQRRPEVAAALARDLTQELGVQPDAAPMVLVTGHRRENFGAGFEQICDALAELARRHGDHLFVYPVHLNPNVQEPVSRRLGKLENVKLVRPQPYGNFVALMHHSRLLLTDSGGVQEEAPSLGKPVLVMRETTERPEGVEAGTVRLVGAHRETIVSEVSRLITNADAYAEMAQARNPYGDGRAAARIVQALSALLLGSNGGA